MRSSDWRVGAKRDARRYATPDLHLADRQIGATKDPWMVGYPLTLEHVRYSFAARLSMCKARKGGSASRGACETYSIYSQRPARWMVGKEVMQYWQGCMSILGGMY